MLYQQPQSGPPSLDQGSLLARGLVFVSSQSTPYDAVSGTIGTPAGSGYQKSIGKIGIGTTLVNSSSSISFGSLNACNVTGDITCLAFALFNDITNDHTALSKCTSNGASNTPFDFGTTVGGGIRLGRANGGYRVWGGSQAVITSRPQVIVATQVTDISVAPKFYLDGVLDTSTATSLYGGSATGAALSNTSTVLAQNRGDLTTGFSGTLFLTAVWNRVLSPSEVSIISANPWQLFFDQEEDEEFSLFSTVVSGPKTYSYTGVGGLMLSGVAAAVKNSIKAPIGGVTISGTLPIVRGRSVQPSGGIAYSGVASVFRGALRAAVGGLTLAGSAAITTFSNLQTRIITPVGGLVVSGSAAVLRSLSRIPGGGFILSGAANIQRSSGGVIVVLGTLNDVIWQKLRIKGGVGTRNDMLNENKYWRDLVGGSNKPLNQVEKDALGSLGKTGALNEQEKDYWSNL